ncbi:uncharacterized protein V2V93DRAFT_374294 [Kockiozyma suomiensis]|uniref:uncharacterized protein n=1 Tax=Kockiozyma suomiensis TaxID=1337062 RepID=UPI003343ED67
MDRIKNSRLVCTLGIHSDPVPIHILFFFFFSPKTLVLFYSCELNQKRKKEGHTNPSTVVDHNCWKICDKQMLFIKFIITFFHVLASEFMVSSYSRFAINNIHSQSSRYNTTAQYQ